jgi:hypothetical protein
VEALCRKIIATRIIKITKGAKRTRIVCVKGLSIKNKKTARKKLRRDATRIKKITKGRQARSASFA